MRVMAASGVLAAFDEAGVLAPADVHVARRLGRLGGESSEAVLLAVALAVRGVRLGSVCVELDRLRELSAEDVDVAALPWPSDVLESLRASPLVVGGPAGPLRPLRLVEGDGGPLLYLDRYYRQEQTVAQALEERAASYPRVDAERLAAALGASFPPVAVGAAAAPRAVGTGVTREGEARGGAARGGAAVPGALSEPAVPTPTVPEAAVGWTAIGGAEPDRQRLAAAVAATRWTTVITGGPGTGKTYTIARLLAVLRGLDPDLRVALAAPTGKAAARLAEEVASHGLALPAVTLHRLLGWRPDSTSRFRHDAENRLPYDVVVVDECSMVSLTMMARLLEAARPDARLVLVGDADQLTSVEAGAVLADLVARPGVASPLPSVVGPDLAGADAAEVSGGVVRLSRGYRFGGTIAALADAVRAGEADAVMTLLRSGDSSISFHTPDDLAALEDDVAGSGRAVVAAAVGGDVEGALDALAGHRLLCAHRHGPWGGSAWDRWARQVVLGPSTPPFGWYPGQPLLVTANDYDAGVWNGDTGVVLADGDGVIAAFDRRPGAPVRLHPSLLAGVQTVYAMTIHRAQGSQYDRVSVVLPAETSSLLTRELIYTAVTRAQTHVRVIGTEESVRAAVERRVLRASGLRAAAPASAPGNGPAEQR